MREATLRRKTADDHTREKLTDSGKTVIFDQPIRSRFTIVKFPEMRSILSMAVFIVMLNGCVGSDVRDPSGYLVVGIESNPAQLDPRYATDANSSRIGSLIYSSLLRLDLNFRWIGDLAESWEMPDPQTFVFHIRQGVTFHDGQPLTAADVKYTYDSILDPHNLSPKRGPLKVVHSVDRLGPYTVRFRLTAPHAPFLEHCTIGIVPAGTATSSNKKGTLPPPGSGPFVLAGIDSGEKLLLRANSSYWEGKPPLAGVVFNIVPDAIVRVLEFRKGTIQLLQNDIEPDTLPWIESNTDAVVQTRQGTTFQYIGINLAHPILKHQKVRQALAHALDREAIIRHILQGQATPANSLLSPLHWAHDDTIPHWSFNPAKATQLLDEAGFRDPDGDGPQPRFKLSFKTTNIDLRRRIAEAFKEQLGKVGIELEVRTYEWGTFYSDIRKGNFHLFSLAWVGILDPDIYYNIFHSSSFPPHGDNRGRYRNDAMDALLEEGRRENDADQRKRLYKKVQQLSQEELPYIPLWWSKNVVVRKPEITGFIPYPDGDLFSLKNTSLAEPPPVK